MAALGLGTSQLLPTFCSCKTYTLDSSLVSQEERIVCITSRLTFHEIRNCNGWMSSVFTNHGYSCCLFV